MPERRTVPGARQTVRFAGVLVLIFLVTACTTVLTRSPVPEQSIDRARPYGISEPLLRVWGDRLGAEKAAEIVRERSEVSRRQFMAEAARGKRPKFTSLALSGGGSDGAFGAGLLAGWTARGDRPEFNAVTGISTGAIIALFAFLGPDYDGALRDVYTTYSTSDLFTPTFFAALTGGTAAFDAGRYRALIDKYVSDDVVARLAREYRKGRLLLIGTTNIDAARPVIWNIGAIAASGSPDAVRLIQDVIQASSAVPAALPPVLIPVEAGGRKYDEMHVDGGATQQVMLYHPGLQTRKIDEAIGVDFDRSIYVIFNNKLEKPYDPVRPRIISIARRALSSLIGGSGDGDVYRIFAIARRDHIDLNIVTIPSDFDVQSRELFDPVYMRALYERGYETGYKGDDWEPYPPGYAPKTTESTAARVDEHPARHAEADPGADVPATAN